MAFERNLKCLETLQRQREGENEKQRETSEDSVLRSPKRPLLSDCGEVWASAEGGRRDRAYRTRRMFSSELAAVPAARSGLPNSTSARAKLLLRTSNWAIRGTSHIKPYSKIRNLNEILVNPQLLSQFLRVGHEGRRESPDGRY